MTVPLDIPEQMTFRWLRVLPRVSLATVVILLLLLATYLGGVGLRDSDNSQGAEYAELLAAARSPGFYRIAMLWDALGWLLIGATLLTLAGVFAARAPLRSAFIAACALGQLSGVLGGFLRLDGVSGLGAQYGAPGTQPTAVLESFADLYRIIGALFHAANLLQGIAWLLVALTALSLAAFPRWLAAWFLLPGLLPLAQFALVAAGQPFSFPIVLVHVTFGIMAPLTVMAARLWRPGAHASAVAVPTAA